MSKGNMAPRKFYTLPRMKLPQKVTLVEPTQQQVVQAQAQLKREDSINKGVKRPRKSKSNHPFD